MCEEIGEESRHGIWHMTFIWVFCIFYVNLCEIANMALLVHLSGE